MTLRPAYFWLVWIGIALVALYFLSDVLLPFVAGMGMAYILHPPMQALEKRGVPRWAGAAIVMSTCFAIGLLTLIIVLPLILEQFAALAQAVPEIIAGIKDRMMNAAVALRDRLPAEDVDRAQQFVVDAFGRLGTWMADLAGKLVTGGLAIFNVLSLFLIMPVVAFYLLRDWDMILATVDSYLPRSHVEVIRDQALQVDRTLAGFIRGQALVCLILAVLYAAGLSAVGLEYGLAIGVIAGSVSFIPYVGWFLGFALSAGVALFQFPDWFSVALVIAVFLAGQVLEGYVLIPTLIGDRVGLHPVWMIFALIAGGALFGFVGLLIAVPAAAVIGVLVRFGLRIYRESHYYDPEIGPPVDG